jgi:tetratricopeptide (TPR) repeat protein
LFIGIVFFSLATEVPPMPSPVAVVDAPPAVAAPRRRIGRWHRFVHRAYLVVYSFLGLNIVAGFIQSIIASGGAALPSWDQLQQVYFVQLARQQPVVFWPAVAALVFLGIAGLIYDRWLAQEEEIQRTEQMIAAADKAVDKAVRPMGDRIDILEARVRGQVASAEATTYGPPFDTLPTVSHFIGRTGEMRRLTAALTAQRLAALRGVAGIGKTTLAAQVARDLRDAGAYPDGVVFVACQEQRTEAAARSLLRDTLARFDARRRPPEATDWTGLGDAARSLLGSKRTLIVLDNIEPELPPDDLRRLVGALHSAGATLLLTARQDLPRDVVPSDASLTLDVLPPDKAADLFAQPFNPPPPDLAASAARITRALGYHTLAIQLVARYAADTRAGDRPALAADLEAQPRLALAIHGDDPQRDLEPIFTRSYEALASPPAPNPAAQRLFAALAAFGTGEMGRRATLAAGAGLGLSTTEADDALALLARRALLTVEADRMRVRLHPLLRAFAAERLAGWAAADQGAVHRAIAAFYADYANANGDAYPTLAADEANISAAIEWAHDHDAGALVVRLCLGMRNYWRDRSRTALSRRYLPWGIAAAEAIAGQTHDRDDRNRLAILVLAHGEVLNTTGQTDAAEQTFTRSRAIFQEIGEERSAAIALSDLGDILLRRGDVAGAEANYRQAIAVLQAIPDVQNVAMGSLILGQLLITKRRKKAEGCAMLHEAERLFIQMGMPQAQRARDLIRELGCGA